MVHAMLHVGDFFLSAVVVVPGKKALVMIDTVTVQGVLGGLLVAQ